MANNHTESDVIAVMATIQKYWVTANGEPELRDFAEYVINLMDIKVAENRREDMQRFVRISAAIKQFNVLAYVKAYKVAKQKGWRSLSMPVYPEVEIMNPDDQIRAIEDAR